MGLHVSLPAGDPVDRMDPFHSAFFEVSAEVRVTHTYTACKCNSEFMVRKELKITS
jgi:hypothetical protein